MSLDYGEKRVGVAVTDPLNIFAYPVTTLDNDSNLIANILKLIDEYNVIKIIIGNPLKENGEESKVSLIVKDFSRKLRNACGIEIELVDERYTSHMAQRRIIESVPTKKKRKDKGLIDKNAAAIMLEDYLRKKSN
ncbi:Holliday junction resolvase-like protein [Melioribacter roseus P3M-2]|uniref:Putative pre-16S rRNA nuclease n=1 Tax=Melioribacter roseus (strain DSM 23840 / JCM 17771 / VKM B-2668 / P3M-2) TaxID=1191523 RepID=I6ZSW1_MELRP|nr:Holliday junction resolvase RuvX [Melioribacter roseus]AFN75129.1 Holliday junction resolvase-like protein [Melioribacter roseus P3M-2]